MERLILYDPTASWDEQQLAYAQRPPSLKGLRLGLVDNLKHNAAGLLQEIARALVDSSGVDGFQLYHKHSPSQPARNNLLDRLAGACDAVICGVGD